MSVPSNEHDLDGSFDLSSSVGSFPTNSTQKVPLYSPVQQQHQSKSYGSFDLSSSVGNLVTTPGQDIPLYSSVELSGISSDQDVSNVQSEQEHSTSKIDLEYNDTPFILEKGIIRYNVDKYKEYKSPVLFGSETETGSDGKRGYYASHLVFDPRTSTLAVGCDVNNKWKKLPNFSLISGIGNSSKLDASFVSGYHNNIVTTYEGDNNYHGIAPACSVVGGSNCTIIKTTHRQNTSTIIGSRGITLKDCDTTVAMAMEQRDSDPILQDLTETLVVRNILALGTIRAKMLDVEESQFNKQSLYLEGSNGETGSNFTVESSTSYDIVYVNPINGTVNIYLGTKDNNRFIPNREITFKDCTLELAPASSYNVNIRVPDISGVTGRSQTRIEYSNNGGYKASDIGSYSLNSSGGSVTLVYMQLPIPGSSPTWVIKNQFIGNPRLLGTSGVKFVATPNETKARIITLNK